MKRIFSSKVTLILIYVLMAAVAVYLNLTAETPDLPNIIVTAVMFFIVLLIFIFAVTRFARIDSMVRDLNEASAQIKNDFRASGTYLWDSYSSRDLIFSNKVLGRRYAEFRDEMDRQQSLSEEIYHCDIEDYFNDDLIDDTVSRSVLNLVGGTMTGLGILGTFIGLTLGLQKFNTGTADEIASSIGPLIQGIKIAFHTSIYGMVFSLFFSFIYKNKMDEAYEAMDRFLSAFRNFVLPDSDNESFRQLVAFEKKQSEEMTQIAGTFAEEISTRVNEIMTPQFDRMNQTIENFATVASEAQVEGVGRIVDRFISEMNRSMGNTLSSLGASIRETVEWQQQDRVYMRNILDEIGRMTNNTSRVNDLAGQSIEHMASYVTKLDQLQGYVADDLAGIEQLIKDTADVSEKQVEHMKMLADYERQVGEFSEDFSRAAAAQIAQLEKASGESLKAVAGTAGRTAESAQQAVGSISAAAESNLKNAVRLSENLTGSMNASAERLSESADKLNQQLTASLVATAESYNRMQEELEQMIYAMDVLRRNIASMNQLRGE